MARDISKYDWLSIEPHRDGWAVYGHGTFEPTSVLAGQPSRTFLDSFDSVNEAEEKYPDAEVVRGSTRVECTLPATPPSWFDPAAAGERWDEDY